MKRYLFLTFFYIGLSTTLFAESDVTMNTIPHKIEKAVSSQAFSSIDIRQVFSASPMIYSVLLFLSISSVTIWLFSLFNFRMKRLRSKDFHENMQGLLSKKKFEEALSFCQQKNTLLANMVAAGIHSRKYGAQVMIDTMKNEGKRGSASFWQKLSLLNDIVIIAPMFGLLGTVIGMFYAFYDVSRSIESINSLFDGLGIAVGTTVVGLIVAIIAMIFYTTLKYRLVKMLSFVENEAMSLTQLIDAER